MKEGRKIDRKKGRKVERKKKRNWRWWGGLRLREIDREKKKKTDRFGDSGPRTRIKEREKIFGRIFCKEGDFDWQRARETEREGKVMIILQLFSQINLFRLHLFDIDSHSQSFFSFFANFFFILMFKCYHILSCFILYVEVVSIVYIKREFT